jgi:hypothetical protein
MINKESLMDDLDIDEEEYQELKSRRLLPDKSDKAYTRFEELLEQGPPYDTDELMFLGKMNLVKLMEKYPVEAHFYMDL